MNGRPTPRRKTAWRSLLTCALACTLVSAFALILSACGSDSAAQGSAFATVTDDNGDTVVIPTQPTRIVSTSSAATQILFALGVGDRVVGVNQWDDYPAEVIALPKVADMQVNTEAVMALGPDLVLGGAGQEEALATIQTAGAPVIILNPPSVEGIYDDIATVGQAVGAEDQADAIIQDMREAFREISATAAASGESPSVFYALDDTLYTCGTGSFVDELLTLASAINAATLDGPTQDYFQFTPEQLVAADPDVVILGAWYGGVDKFASDPRFTGLTAVRDGRVFVLDEQYDKLLTLAAPRIVEGFEGLVETIHPQTAITD